MHAETIQAFVLSALDYGESDRIISLFSLEHGRLKGFARGARKSRKRFGAALEPFARIELQLRMKEGLVSLRQAEIINIYPAVRADLAAIAHALYACELTEAMTPEGHPLPRLYRLLAAYLDHLETGQASSHDRLFFEINLLNILGYRPSLESCSHCGAPFGALGGQAHGEGVLACTKCAPGGDLIDALTLKVLTACLGTGKFGLISFPSEPFAQAGMLLDQAVAAHSGRKLKSKAFLDEVA